MVSAKTADVPSKRGGAIAGPLVVVVVDSVMLDDDVDSADVDDVVVSDLSAEQLVSITATTATLAILRLMNTPDDTGTAVDPAVGYSVHWAGWRSKYFEQWADRSPSLVNDCPFCTYLSSGASDADALIVRRTQHAMVILNRFPYTAGHVLIMPLRHVGDLGDLTADESADVWQLCREAETTLRQVLNAEGVNIGFNLSRAAGAAIPGHLHAHALPRWVGDTNFAVAIANMRIIPEALTVTQQRLSQGWVALSAN